jgi:hypothetical protein
VVVIRRKGKIMLSAEMVKITDEARTKLFFCMDRKQVEDVFGELGVQDAGAKAALLRSCMRVTKVYSCPDGFTDEDNYADDLVAFVDGTWRQLL